MELKLARTELSGKPKKIDIEKIDEQLSKHDATILYFDRENSHKDLLKLQDYYETKGRSFYMREVRYGLAETEYMYEVHIL